MRLFSDIRRSCLIASFSILYSCQWPPKGLLRFKRSSLVQQVGDQGSWAWISRDFQLHAAMVRFTRALLQPLKYCRTNRKTFLVLAMVDVQVNDSGVEVEQTFFEKKQGRLCTFFEWSLCNTCSAFCFSCCSLYCAMNSTQPHLKDWKGWMMVRAS